LKGIRNKFTQRDLTQKLGEEEQDHSPLAGNASVGNDFLFLVLLTAPFPGRPLEFCLAAHAWPRSARGFIPPPPASTMPVRLYSTGRGATWRGRPSIMAAPNGLDVLAPYSIDVRPETLFRLLSGVFIWLFVDNQAA